MKLIKIKEHLNINSKIEYYVDKYGRKQGIETISLCTYYSDKPFRILMSTFIDDKRSGLTSVIENNRITTSCNLKNGIYHGKHYEIKYNIRINKVGIEKSIYKNNVKDGFSSYYTYDKMNNSIFSHQTLFINHELICHGNEIMIDDTQMISWLESRCKNSDTKSRIAHLHDHINDKYNNWIVRYF